MEKMLASSNLYSHPGRLLEDHLIGVARLAELFLSEKPREIIAECADICKITALTHDIGKATYDFQQYLLSNGKNKRSRSKLTTHSPLSAICSFYLTKELARGDYLKPFFAYVIVRRHHGDLIAVLDEASFYDDEEKNNLQEQVEKIDKKKFQFLADSLKKAGLNHPLDLETVKSWVLDFQKDIKCIKKRLRGLEESYKNYLILNTVYSILLDADKSDAVIRDFNQFTTRQTISDKLVDIYKSKTIFPESPINNLRERAYKEALNKLESTSERIISINLPTGLGKTLTSLAIALKIRNRLGTNHRIIYALPFLSIIDQTYEVFENVIRANNLEPTSDMLLKHHHLADLYYKQSGYHKQSGDDETESDEAKILIEGWNSEIIITTFFQFFHSLISNRNKTIRRFHKIANSIIILDEIQAIPIKYWLLLRDMLFQITEKMNTYVILATATEPLIFPRDRIQSLVNKEIYYETLDRISMDVYLDKDMTLPELANFITFEEGKRYLFIFNTISAARNFFKIIYEKTNHATYLSTHVIPKQRIERIKELKKGMYQIAVSTQLVEAGVDIDFDVVVRDIAPMDSINQAAGRCNRNGEKKGQVLIMSLKDDNGKPYSSYIYDPVLLDITKSILAKKRQIKEKEILTLIDEYYLEVEKKRSQDISREITKSIMELNYKDGDGKLAIGDFKLIDKDYDRIDVFIAFDEEAIKIWNAYMNLNKIDDLFERKKGFDNLKSAFYQYVISIPRSIKNFPPNIGDIGYIENSKLSDYYDPLTGFITKEAGSVLLW